jgi:hypothetical protein
METPVVEPVAPSLEESNRYRPQTWPTFPNNGKSPEWKLAKLRILRQVQWPSLTMGNHLNGNAAFNLQH